MTVQSSWTSNEEYFSLEGWKAQDISHHTFFAGHRYLCRLQHWIDPTEYLGGQRVTAL
jgi:hypothetical protein